MNIDSLLYELTKPLKSDKYNIKYRQNSTNATVNIITDEFFNELLSTRTHFEVIPKLKEIGIHLISLYPNTIFINYHLMNLAGFKMERYKDIIYIYHNDDRDLLWKLIPESIYELYYKIDYTKDLYTNL